MRRHLRSLITVGICMLSTVVVTLAGLAAGAAARPINAIGRANLDGSAVNRAFVPIESPTSALAADGSHIYWGGPAGIGRANADGSNPNPSFIPGPHLNACGLAVDGSHIYWMNHAQPPASETIGRANLDGSGVNSNFIGNLPPGQQIPGPELPGLDTGFPSGLAVGGSHLYWADNLGGIGRANLDGSAPTIIVPGGEATGLYFGSNPCITVDSSHLYWQNACTAGIGRANLDGSAPNPSFIPGPGSSTPVGGGGSVCEFFGLAVDPGHLYAMAPNGRMARANVDGSALDEHFISELSSIASASPSEVSQGGLAVDGAHVYWTDSIEIGYGETVLVAPISGTPSVHLPAGSGGSARRIRSRQSPLNLAGRRGFTPLSGSMQIPVGSSLDTTRGRVRITSARKPNKKATETGEFYGGVFKVIQPKHGKPTTEVVLISRRRGARRPRLTRRRRQNNGLWGNAKGNYVTKGRHGSATVRGTRRTIWFTRDRRNGTFFKVKKGRVLVRDSTRHRKVFLHAGQHYLAPVH
jgi:hypothetical protein